ncbi:MAG: phosphonopyruvate decarboxylase [Proteobacteria bacterium]|nr:phosphonopyruvate decarboxylase [Pseudomonadota bacterium]
MIEAESFLAAARERGFDFYSGVPCSFLTPLINRVIGRAIGDPEIRYVGAASEGEAVAIAAGAWLAGRATVVMCQNSGLGNMINPLTSLNGPFRIPTLLIVTLRGEPGRGDEPQHELMGRITTRLLDDIGVPSAGFPDHEEAIAPGLDAACATLAETDLPYALVLRQGGLAEASLDPVAPAPRPLGQYRDLNEGGPRPTRIAALRRVLDLVPDQAALIATTGKCGRELFTLADRPQHLYQVGSMGCAGAMGLGVALNARRPVVVLDGDGAALMKLGALATIGAQGPENLVHLVLDNGVHDSTGGQATVSANVDFARVALACGYRRAAACDSIEGLARALSESLAGPGPALVHLRIAPGSIAKLGRPTISPPEVARRFRAFLAGA